MAKLGYTWYPKDWTNSEAVFELNLMERGLYRELIDIAMLNDNKTQVNKRVWCRKFACLEDELNNILKVLIDLKLIEITDGLLFIPSCEPRLQLSRNGKKGGQKSKPPKKPVEKPNPKPSSKPTSNQKKDKRKEKENKVIIPTWSEFLSYALESKKNVNQKNLELKYKSWVANEWKDGNDKEIKNWKTKLLNTIQYLGEQEVVRQMPKTVNREDFFTD